MIQAAGLVLVAVGAWLLWSPWALVIAGLLMLVVPEIAQALKAVKRP